MSIVFGVFLDAWLVIPAKPAKVAVETTTKVVSIVASLETVSRAGLSFLQLATTRSGRMKARLDLDTAPRKLMPRVLVNEIKRLRS
jgi:hypothetical protein